MEGGGQKEAEEKGCARKRHKMARRSFVAIGPGHEENGLLAMKKGSSGPFLEPKQRRQEGCLCGGPSPFFRHQPTISRQENRESLVRTSISDFKNIKTPLLLVPTCFCQEQSRNQLQTSTPDIGGRSHPFLLYHLPCLHQHQQPKEN